MTLVDTNVVLDILSKDPKWFAWSLNAIEAQITAGTLLINEVIYAELAARMDSETDLNAAVDRLGLSMERTPQSALFLAGRSFRRYRLTGGTRTGVLPDLFVGAHAEVRDYAILTRDVRRYRIYFPNVALITPEQ